MRSSTILSVAVLISMLVVGGAAHLALADTGQSAGYVQYRVSVSSPVNPVLSRTFLVNESAKSTGQAGFVNLTLSLASNGMNFSYSKDVNSSSLPMIFPYLAGLTNQSFSFALRGISITANLVNTGEVPVNFNSVSYQGTKYLIHLSTMNSSSMRSISANGSIISMPSGLIYMVQLSLNQLASVNATLLSTSLQLTGPQTRFNLSGASILGVGAVAATAIAAPTIFMKVKHNKPNDQTGNKTETGEGSNPEKDNGDKEKPSYWVD